MIDQEDYQAFVWIKNDINDGYEKAIVDPWKATAFTALTGKYVYTRIHMSPQDIDNEAYDFIRGGSKDTDFLRQNGISIVYTRVFNGRSNTDYSSDNPDLMKVAKNIYLVKESKQR